MVWLSSPFPPCCHTTGSMKNRNFPPAVGGKKLVRKACCFLIAPAWKASDWVVKNPPTKAGEVETCAQFLGQEDPPTPGFLPGEFHGQRSLAGYSPWGHHWATNTFTSIIFYPQTQAVGQRRLSVNKSALLINFLLINMWHCKHFSSSREVLF